MCLFPKAAHFLKKKRQFCPPTLHSASRRSSFHLMDPPTQGWCCPQRLYWSALCWEQEGGADNPPLQTLPVIQSRHPFIPQIGNPSSANSATTCISTWAQRDSRGSAQIISLRERGWGVKHRNSQSEMRGAEGANLVSGWAWGRRAQQRVS